MFQLTMEIAHRDHTTTACSRYFYVGQGLYVLFVCVDSIYISVIMWHRRDRRSTE